MCVEGCFSQIWSQITWYIAHNILILYLECIYIHTAGNYNNEDIRQLSDVQTCVTKDLRPGFEGHDVVEISWTPHLTHGMYIHMSFCNIDLLLNIHGDVLCMIYV